MTEENGRSEGARDAERPRVDWLDAAETATKPRAANLAIRGASFAASIWLVLKPLLLYLAIPCLAVLSLIVLVVALRLHPLIGGLIFAVGLGVGLTVYFDEIVR